MVNDSAVFSHAVLSEGIILEMAVERENAV